MDLEAPGESPAAVLANAGLEMGRVLLATQVVDGLRNLVLSGRIPPGTKLIQEQVAAELGVSRTPLREAMRVLVNEGLLTPIPSSGSVRVVSPSIDEVRDLYQVREVIDGLAARLCSAATLSPSVLSRLKESVDQLARALEPFDLNAFVTAHADFHVLIVASSGNTRVQQMEPLVRMSAQMLFRQFASGGERIKQSTAEHQAILGAILAKDQEAAERLARAHISAASAHWIAKMQQDAAETAAR
jgi:DNA-binding GntR family transcriptional regulator